MAEGTRRMLDAAQIVAGSRVLDVGTGTGETAIAAAVRAGRDGRVVAIDLSAAMVQSAKANLRQAGVDWADVHVMDGADLKLEDASVDAVIGRNAMQFLSRWPSPLRGFHRVLRSGGHLAFLVWAPKERNRYFQLPISVAEEHGWMRVPLTELESPYALQDAERLAADLQAAGFHDVGVEFVLGQVEMTDGTALLDYLRQGAMFRLNYDQLDGREREQFDKAMTAAMETFRQGDGYRVAVTSLLASATR